jgi:hypothetical protein
MLDSKGAIFTVENPEIVNPRTSSDYLLKIEGIPGEAKSNYTVFYFANSAEPTLNLTTPNHVTTSTTLEIDWASSAADTIPLDLFYALEEDYQKFVQDDAPVSPLATYPISVSMNATLGSYTWQPIGLASGDYRIVARLNHPIHGLISAYSPGTFTYADATPPQVPINVTLEDAPDGADDLILAWTRNREADLARYEILYSMPTLDAPSGFFDRIINVAPTDHVLAHPTHEQVRLPGLLIGTSTTVCVRAVDASGNRSNCTTDLTGAPTGTGANRPDAPVLNSVNVGAKRSLIADWKGEADGYLLGWGSDCNATYSGMPALEGNTNLNVNDVKTFALNGLKAGTYTVSVRGYGGNVDVLTAWSDPLIVVLTNGVDANADGLPDDWATRYGVSGATQDPDGDNLNNAQELANATNPTNPDSDGDGYGDGDEVNVGSSDPCVRESRPAEGDSYQLALYALTRTPSLNIGLDFQVAENDPFSGVNGINVGIVGTGGTVNWTVTASDSWIDLSTLGGDLLNAQEVDQLDIGVDGTGMTPGFYQGSVTINATGSDPVFGAPRSIPVRMWVLREISRPNTILDGLIFDDTDGDGDRDPGEPVVRDATLLVIDGNGMIIAEIPAGEDGTFNLREIPFAGYQLLACRSVCDGAIPDNVVPVALSDINSEATGLEIPFVDSVPTAVGLQVIESGQTGMRVVWLLFALSAVTFVVWYWRRVFG